MPAIDAATLNALVSSPLALTLAGALAALIVVGLVMAWRRASGRLLLPLAALALLVVAAGVLVDRLALAQQAAERRALMARAAALDRAAFAPGSALACLDAGADEAVENACEKAVFASPQAAAGAVAYMGARLQLLKDAAALAPDKHVAAALAASRRAIELDRYGVAAQVLARRDGCTAAHCGAFALLDDAKVLQANLKAQVFEQYVSRYAAGWNAAPAKARVVSQAPSAAPAATAAPVAASALPAQPIKPGEHWDFPSAASIPPVSIMNAEPPLPKSSEPAPQATPTDAKPPLPPKRPAGEAKTPPVR